MARRGADRGWKKGDPLKDRPYVLQLIDLDATVEGLDPDIRGHRLR